MATWIKDDNGNRCSVERWGSKEAAEAKLKTLERCFDCSDCSNCSGCSDCSNCSRCSNCSDCSRCSDCSDCSNLKDCKPAKAEPLVIPKLVIPKIENIHARVLEAVSAPDAFDMGDWHKCETTHCRAGWVVTLAGDAGKALEKRFDTPLAALMIYKESSPIKVAMTRFYDGNTVAMDDIKRCAAEEAGVK